MKENDNKNSRDNNSGNYNTGNYNTGDWNSGDWNTGDYNTGNYNTGDSNSGYSNSGYSNSGYSNSGYSNSGGWNTGNKNTGNFNTGHSNTGDSNSGYRNSGYWNTGDWNSGGYNTGYCNSITPDECFIFNKRGSRKEWEQARKPKWMKVFLTKWIDESEMTKKEKEDNPTHKVTDGYLKCYDSLTEAYIESWENTTQEDRDLTRKLPNFDEEVFEEVFGFNPWNKKTKIIVIDGESIEISEESYEEIKRKLL